MLNILILKPNVVKDDIKGAASMPFLALKAGQVQCTLTIWVTDHAGKEGG